MTRDERQLLGVQRWKEAGCRGTLMYSTGVGKTRCAMIAITRFLVKNKDKIVKIIVPTEALKIQWMDELHKNDLFEYCDVTIINTAIRTPSPVDFLVLDECHRYGADTFFNIFRQTVPKLILGLSATFDRLDGRHELLSQYCPVCDIITVSEAIKNNWLAPYKEYKVLLRVDDIEEYRRANIDFHSSFAFFGGNFDIAMKCMTDVRYRNTYAKRVGADHKEVAAQAFTWGRALRTRNQFVKTHPKKIEIAEKILEARKDKKAITFSATIEQAEKIKYGQTIHSGKTKKKNRITLEEFSKMDCGVINTAKSLDEGADVPGLNLAIILCNTSSKSQKTQRIGRVIRYQPGKEAEIFTLVIKGTNEESWFNTSTAGKSYIEISENELDEILSGKETENPIKEAKEAHLMFRL